jgi:hypothetical protein
MGRKYPTLCQIHLMIGPSIARAAGIGKWWIGYIRGEPHQVPLAPGAIGAINADEVAPHQVPLAPGAIGAINADEVAPHQVPLVPGAIGAINARNQKQNRWRNKALRSHTNQRKGLSAIPREREGFVNQFVLFIDQVCARSNGRKA